MPYPRVQDQGASKLRAVTPSDVTNFTDGVCNALSIGTTGNVAVLAENDTSAVTISVVAGQVLPVRAVRVNSTNTTSTGIVAMYHG